MAEPGDPRILDLATRLTAAEAAARLDAAERLARAGDAAAAVALPLVTACGDADEGVRDQAVAALEDLGAPPADAIPGLIEQAANPDPLVAYWAITLLGRSGETAAAAVKALAQQLGAASDSAVRQRAAWALGRIGPAARQASEALRTATTSNDPRLARLAEEALAALSGR
jgi:HEAT repeat protein